MMMSARQPVKAMSVAKYMLLPGILPWLRKMSLQLGGIFFIFTQIMGAVKLIDPSHPCLKLENRHAYSFADVLLIAWDNLEFKRQNTSEILMFFAVLLSVVLFIAIIGIAFVYIFFSFGGAHAQYLGTPSTSIPYDVDQDWAFQFLDRMFGGQTNTGMNFWIQNEGPGMIGNPWLSAILIGMLKLYSQALMLIASFMILYIVMVTLADAARSGRPFGESFDGVWAPIRFALAVGLLVPFSGTGFNGAQLIVFQTAEMGSNMATNIWHRALEDFGKCGENGSSSRCNFISSNVSDYGYKYLRDVFLINLCVYGYNAAIEDGGITDENTKINIFRVSESGNTEIYSFGSKQSVDYCGQVAIPKRVTPMDIPTGYLNPNPLQGETTRTAENYLPMRIADDYRVGAQMFFPPSGMMQGVATVFAKEQFCKHDQVLMDIKCEDGQLCSRQVKNWIQAYWKTGMGRRNGDDLGTHFFQAHAAEMTAYNNWIVESMKRDAKYGWATAGVFYLRMTSAINILSSAIENSPRVIKLPANYNRMYATPHDPTIDDEDAEDQCGGWFGGGAQCASYDSVQTLYTLIRKGADWFRVAPTAEDLDFYATLTPTRYQSALRMPDSEEVNSSTPTSQLNPIANYIFESVRIGDNTINPLGVVISWGDTMFTAASIAYTLAIASSLLSWIPGWGSVAATLASLFETVGNTLIIPGFTLLIVVPFLPFLYFTFAVVEWAVSIIEAVIGIPLWVLTFIRRQGDLLGPAMSGVKMLFEIMLRPTIIVFSLIAAIITFSAGVIFFENAMKLYMGIYTSTTAQPPAISLLLGLGLVFIFMFGVYSLATSCFKLIEAIPDQFGRWLDMDGGFGSQIKMGETNPYMVAAGAMAAVSVAKSLNRDAQKMVSKKEKNRAAAMPLGGPPPVMGGPPAGGPTSGGPTGGGGSSPPPTSPAFMLGGGTGGGSGGGTGGGSTGSGGGTGSSGGASAGSTGSSGSGSSGNANNFGGGGGYNSTNAPNKNSDPFASQNWDKPGFNTEQMVFRMTVTERQEYKANAYKALGIDKNATFEEVKKAYKKLSQQYHPDRNPGDAVAEEKSKALSAYYSYLKYEMGGK